MITTILYYIVYFAIVAVVLVGALAVNVQAIHELNKEYHMAARIRLARIKFLR